MCAAAGQLVKAFSRGRALLAMLAVAGLMYVEQPACFTCCPSVGPGTTIASASCCDEGCGRSSLEKGGAGPCLLAAGSSTPIRSLVAALPSSPSAQVGFSAEAETSDPFRSPSPPRAPLRISLRL